jgi:hypothetical protein
VLQLVKNESLEGVPSMPRTEYRCGQSMRGRVWEGGRMWVWEGVAPLTGCSRYSEPEGLA